MAWICGLSRRTRRIAGSGKSMSRGNYLTPCALPPPRRRPVSGKSTTDWETSAWKTDRTELHIFEKRTVALYIAPANGCAGRCRWASLGGIVFSSPGWAGQTLTAQGSAILALTRLVGRSFSVPTSVLPSKVSAVICLCRYFTPSRAWVFYISAVANFSHGSGRWMAGRQTLPCAISVNPVQPPFRMFFCLAPPL